MMNQLETKKYQNSISFIFTLFWVDSPENNLKLWNFSFAGDCTRGETDFVAQIEVENGRTKEKHTVM